MQRGLSPPAASQPPGRGGLEFKLRRETKAVTEVTERIDEAPSRRFRPYPEYMDSGVDWLGAIPTHWEVKPVKAALIRNDSGVWGEDFDDEGTIVLRSTEQTMQGGWRIEEPARRRLTAREATYARLRVGDLLVTKSSGSAHHIGKTSLVDEPIAALNCCYSNFMQRLRVSTEQVPQFLWYFMNCAVARDQLVFLSSTTTGLANLNGSILGAIRIPMATPDEQRAIADFLNRETAKIDGLVARKERLIELLQEKRTALITRAVTRGLDPNVPMKDSGVEWLGETPAHWEVKRLKNVSTFVTSGSRGWAEFYSDEGPFFLRIGNVQSGSIDLNIDDVQHVDPPRGSEGDRTRVKPGDVLVSITALIGAVAVVSEDLPEAFVNQHLALIRLSTLEVDSRWIAYCVMSPVGQTQFAADLYGGTKDGLGLDDVRSLVVLAPPIREQKRIVAYLDSEGTKLMELVQAVRTAINLLREFRTALISAAVTGKVDVREVSR